eukprot:TRINITY_DN11184_c0_g1_i2.p1 TRINITY_DN11184_c0_g1~~TRINITY_DN11184_c0_g1_i2.p1  ORF type:complete len:746 (+),score=173.95 TRINITY_DN11184_c0_g1_i2:187-2424(+)
MALESNLISFVPNLDEKIVECVVPAPSTGKTVDDNNAARSFDKFKQEVSRIRLRFGLKEGDPLRMTDIKLAHHGLGDKAIRAMVDALVRGLHGLHMSHNYVSPVGVSLILSAAVSSNRYPMWREDRGEGRWIPLWLRIEQQAVPWPAIDCTLEEEELQKRAHELIAAKESDLWKRALEISDSRWSVALQEQKLEKGKLICVPEPSTYYEEPSWNEDEDNSDYENDSSAWRARTRHRYNGCYKSLCRHAGEFGPVAHVPYFWSQRGWAYDGATVPAWKIPQEALLKKRERAWMTWTPQRLSAAAKQMIANLSKSTNLAWAVSDTATLQALQDAGTEDTPAWLAARASEMKRKKADEVKATADDDWFDLSAAPPVAPSGRERNGQAAAAAPPPRLPVKMPAEVLPAAAEPAPLEPGGLEASQAPRGTGRTPALRPGKTPKPAVPPFQEPGKCQTRAPEPNRVPAAAPAPEPKRAPAAAPAAPSLSSSSSSDSSSSDEASPHGSSKGRGRGKAGPKGRGRGHSKPAAADDPEESLWKLAHSQLEAQVRSHVASQKAAAESAKTAAHTGKAVPEADDGLEEVGEMDLPDFDKDAMPPLGQAGALRPPPRNSLPAPAAPSAAPPAAAAAVPAMPQAREAQQTATPSDENGKPKQTRSSKKASEQPAATTAGAVAPKAKAAKRAAKAKGSSAARKRAATLADDDEEQLPDSKTRKAEERVSGNTAGRESVPLAFAKKLRTEELSNMAVELD